MDQLDRNLSLMYQADVLKKGDYATVLRLARDQLAADQSIRQAALAKIAELEPVVRSKRDSAWVERKQLDYCRLLVAENVDA